MRMRWVEIDAIELMDAYKAQVACRAIKLEERRNELEHDRRQTRKDAANPEIDGKK